LRCALGGVVGKEICGGRRAILIDSRIQSIVHGICERLGQRIEVIQVSGDDIVVVIEQCAKLAARDLTGDVGASAAVNRRLLIGEIARDIVGLVANHQRRLAADQYRDRAAGHLQSREIDVLGELFQRGI
jgi:hypothetical protein